MSYTSLPLSARLLVALGPPATILATASVSPRAALFTPLAFLPTAWFYKKWQQRINNESTKSEKESSESELEPESQLEPLVWTFAAASTLGITTAAATQGAICVLASKLLFPSQDVRRTFWEEFRRASIADLTAGELASRTQLASSWQNWAFNAVLAFLAAGLIEEIIKFLPVVYARKKKASKSKRKSNTYVDYAIAGALGFSLAEQIGFIYVACEPGHETGWILVRTLAERAVGSLGHLLVAWLTALRARDQRTTDGNDSMPWWKVVGPSALLHGMSDMIVFSASAVAGNVGFIHPSGSLAVAMIGLAGSVWSVAGWMVRRELQYASTV
ncbi:hypothetical protein ASPZODRAFT_137145 [Penicilliopsis zonata CBS 506.65]|uniref:PrsW family intramembrane metalloprotease n=1 Tax=Penicilliopsis zonata CBS 506.65 TaxID=1073090 RepID=A0A1L9S6G2_9EURO|nr:hypothetical protein ASPZODRAFT_137145 [Penicilliopsis zonata CBS 506.65]OJJ42752.1 hypothetical protein ASPZODRAFT_137145 [Penicilliopsis zonata CBS 506.65]